MKSISANLNIMIKASEKASKILIRDYGEIENLQVSTKGPGDFVSSADKRTDKIIIDERRIRRRLHHEVLCELLRIVMPLRTTRLKIQQDSTKFINVRLNWNDRN